MDSMKKISYETGAPERVGGGGREGVSTSNFYLGHFVVPWCLKL